MNAVVYLFQVSACMGIFYLFYYLLLSRYTFFTINRWYLIITLAISFIIPLLTITVQQQDAYPQVIKQVVYINQMQTTQQVIVADQTPAQVQINWMALLKMVYIASVAALFLRLMLIVVKFFTRIKNKKRTKIGGVNIVQGDEGLSNGSFFNYIFLNNDELSADELEQIIAHEMLHVKLYHSVDRILIKIAQVFLWFNPFVYLYARAIEENHEFEVDHAISNSTDRNKYAELLFHLSVARQGTLYHNFSMVPLKKRITMLFTKPTNRMKKIIYLLVVPVVLISCLAFAKLKSEAPAKAKKSSTSVLADSNAVKYRQKSKLTPAQRKGQDESFKKMQAYFESGEGRKIAEHSRELSGKTLTFEVEDNTVVKNIPQIKLKDKNHEYLLFPFPTLRSLKKGDVITVNISGAGYSMESPVISIHPAWVTKDGKKIFEAEKIPFYPFLYEANKVRFTDGQITNITKYPNGKWKTAVFDRGQGYKFNLSFKPDAPNLNSIKGGDNVRLRFIHEVKTGEKTYKINDWVAISKDIKDYGIKNPDWFYKFYEIVKADTGKVSAIGGIEGLGANPLVLINGKEYDKDILFKISMRGVKGTSTYPPNNGTTKYGDKAKDGAVIIDTRDGEINFMTATERQNLMKLRAAKGKFFSRITLTNEDGSKYDVARITRANGSGASANMQTDGKIAFIINNKLYNEAQFKRLFKADKASYGPSIGVGGGSKELVGRGFNLDGYDLVFEFDPGATSKVSNAPIKTGAIAPGKNGNDKTETGGVNLVANKTPQYRSWNSGTNSGIGKPVLITGGQSGFNTGNNTRSIGFTVGFGRVKPADATQTDKVTVPEGKDTVSNNSLKQIINTMPGFEVRSDGTLWANNQPIKKAMINGIEYTGSDVSQAINTLPAEVIEKLKITNTPRILVDGKEFIPAKVADKVKVTNTPKILVDGKEFIPATTDKTINIDMKKDLLNGVPMLKAGYRTANDSLAAASFSGTVKAVQDIMGTKMVVIQNGDLFAVYANLKNVNVSRGQDVKKGQLLGVAAFNPEENKVAVHFELYRSATRITDKTEQETILKSFEPKLNMKSNFKNMYAYFLPKTNKPL